MSRKEQIIEGLVRVRGELSERFHVRSLALFGSFGRDEAHADSDLDLLVEFDVPLGEYIRNKENLRAYLKELFGREVDLANPQSLKSAYRDQILSQAIYV